MTSLARDAAAFKSTLQSVDTKSWHSSSLPSQSAPQEHDHAGKKKKRPKPSMSYIVYSQPADTGTGTNVNTQLLYAVNHLKSVNAPMRLQDLAIVTNTPLDTDKVLLDKFRAHERVEFDAKTNLYSFRHDYNFRNKAALLTEIQRATRRGGGLSIRSLKESWKDAPVAIEELEKEGEVFVTRTLKDGQMRMVFWNEVKAEKAPASEDAATETIDGNGTGLSVEKEFYDLWHNMEVPNEVDLLKQLENEGLQATVAEAPVPKAPTGKKKGKRVGPRDRKVRITNIHLKGQIDLSRDYLPPGKVHIDLGESSTATIIRLEQLEYATFNNQHNWNVTPSADATGSLIFNNVNSLLQRWPNTYWRNGHTIVPATIPSGTILYHGRSDNEVPTNPEWLAFDFEHSYIFCRGPCYVLSVAATRNLRLAYFDGSSAAKTTYGSMDSQDIFIWGYVRLDKMFADRERIDELCKWGSRHGIDGFVRMEMHFEVMLCDFSEGVEVVSLLNLLPKNEDFSPRDRPLHPPVIDTFREDSDAPPPAGKEREIPGRFRNMFSGDRIRMPGSFLGRLRRQQGYFNSPPSNLPSSGPPVPPHDRPFDFAGGRPEAFPGGPPEGPGGPGRPGREPPRHIPQDPPKGWKGKLPSMSASGFEVVHAGSWHDRAPGETRVHLDYSRLVTLYDPSLLSLVEARRGETHFQHRLLNISASDTKRVGKEIAEVFTRDESIKGSGVDWSSVTRVVVERYGERLDLLKYLLEPTTFSNITEQSELFRAQLLIMLSPYMVTHAVPDEGSKPTVDVAWLSPVVHYCSTTQTSHIRRDTLTSQEEKILAAVEETLHEICRVLGVMWVHAFDIETATEQLLGELVKGWREQVKSLMNWLDWSMWVRCESACGPESICHIPTWPFRSDEDPNDMTPRSLTSFSTTTLTAMEPAEPSVHHRRTLHSKRSFGKYPHKIDSPAYDASEEDNDPLTDDAASALSVPAPSRPFPVTASQPRVSGTLSASSAQSSAPISALKSRPKHHLASAMLSDDGVDSPTYDGDIESSTTAGPDRDSSKASSLGAASHPHSSSTSTLTSPASALHVLPADNPDVLLTAGPMVVTAPSTASSSDAEPITVTVSRPHVMTTAPPDSVSVAQEAFDPAALTPADIQIFVRKAIDGELHRKYNINEPPVGRPVRVYADGVYDLFHFGHALQLRQAKMSFPDVYLLVGVNSDEQVKEHKFSCIMSHAERCEAARHCRWVDEVVPEAPWVIDEAFVEKYQIDYVAHDENPYVSAGHEDVYSFVKSQGKFIPTRRTPGVSTSSLLERIVKGYRKRDFDKKLEKMGHAELMAQGSDYEEKEAEP
ncbi:hypothetical protein EW146_g3336 [Bondarzewia mesenterica]|uniref:TFIIE beta domain-containing protein n=1 Tax=Bondarzewia mesenterica TaxID=1095465 RepID=A0A4S4LYB3_9AGAM|nr:hypothetical protein EW146_g3336 [Bondarzewia mesenterica]